MMDTKASSNTSIPTPKAARKITRELHAIRFHRLRKERGLTLQKVADRLHLSVSKMSLFEASKQGLSLKQMERLEAILCPGLLKTTLKKHAEERKRESDMTDLRAWQQRVGRTAEEEYTAALAKQGFVERADLDLAANVELTRAYNEVIAMEQQVRALEGQVEAQAREIRAIKKTQEPLLRWRAEQRARADAQYKPGVIDPSDWTALPHRQDGLEMKRGVFELKRNFLEYLGKLPGVTNPIFADGKALLKREIDALDAELVAAEAAARPAKEDGSPV